MDYLLRIFNESIAGIIYFTAFTFFFLRYIKHYNIRFIKNNKEMILYLAIPVVFASRILGGVAQNILSHIIMLICPNMEMNVQDLINPISINQNILNSKNDTYSTLVFYRHLICSIFLLCISLMIWFRKKEHRWITVFISVIIISVLVLGYLFTRNDLIAINSFIKTQYAQ